MVCIKFILLLLCRGKFRTANFLKKICPSFFPYFSKKHNINFKKKPKKWTLNQS